jgi:hypothetical protein
VESAKAAVGHVPRIGLLPGLPIIH